MAVAVAASVDPNRVDAMIEALAGGNIWLVVAIKTGIAAGVFFPVISLVAMFSIWWERKVAGHIQCRVGPMHTGVWHGWAQSLADGIKLLLKEDLIPAGADQFLFRLAPYLAFAPVFAGFLLLPFGPQLVFESGLHIGVLYILAVLSIEVMGVILAGWASNSKWSVYGAMREACQLVSYEIPLGLAILCGVIVAGTLDVLELSYLQGAGLWGWFVFHNPFIFGAFVLYFIASLAENKRAPFDLPEAESELVAGFHTEYSGLRFSFFFFAEYAGMFIVGGILAVLFLGGWNSPFGGADPVYAMVGYDPIAAGQAYFSGAIDSAVMLSDKAAAINNAAAQIGRPISGLTGTGLAVINAYSALWFVVKVMTYVFTLIWIRWTLPRIRIDQVLYACVKVLLPLSLVAFVGTAVWVAVVKQPIAATVGGEQVVRLGHLVKDTPGIQFATQVLLMLCGIGVVCYALGVITWAFLNREDQPRKTFFPDVMPVGNRVAFTTSGDKTGAVEAAGDAG